MSRILDSVNGRGLASMIGNLRGVSARGVEGNCSFRPSVIRLIAVRTSEELHRIRSFFGRRVQRILQNAADGPSNWKILSPENDLGVTTARLHPLGMDSQKSVSFVRSSRPSAAAVSSRTESSTWRWFRSCAVTTSIPRRRKPSHNRCFHVLVRIAGKHRYRTASGWLCLNALTASSSAWISARISSR